jgi:tetratricopeptide (TPR) repeat protein
MQQKDRLPLRPFLFLVFVCLLLTAHPLHSQKAKADSLTRILATEKKDTSRVTLLWKIASATSVYNPDTALTIAFESLSLARKSGYTEGESRATGILGNIFIRIGNYPKALEMNIEKLKIEEQRNVPQNLASVLMNIGIVYALQEEYAKALEYYHRADSIIEMNNVEVLKYNIALNTGDTWDRLNQSDSAFRYFDRSLAIARAQNDGDLIGTSLTGLGHSYRKLKRYQEAHDQYETAIVYLQEAQDDEMLCEATLGLARLFEETQKADSAGFYGGLSLRIAKSGGFLSKELEAAEFLTDHFRTVRNIDSAFSYVNYVRGLSEEVNSKDKIRESQIISSNEQFRQLEVHEEKIKEQKKRNQQLQMLLIAIFIPGIFLLTLALSRVNVPVKLIRLLGILSLLFLFEYLTLLLHPTVANLTHHTPVYEILIFVAIAAILIPAHHKLEHWMIHKLLHHRHHRSKPAPAPETAVTETPAAPK